MSITQITERELQLTHYLAETTKALELMRQERDALLLRVAESKTRALAIVGWHLNDYNRAQIHPILNDMREGM